MNFKTIPSLSLWIAYGSLLALLLEVRKTEIVKGCKRIDEVLNAASKPNLNTTFFAQHVLIIYNKQTNKTTASLPPELLYSMSYSDHLFTPYDLD